MKTTKGKTYEEIYGKVKAIQLRQLRRKSAIRQMAKQRKGKTLEEIYGKEKGKKLHKALKQRLTGETNPNYKGGKIKKNCSFCNKIIFVRKLFVRERNYCSTKCFGLDKAVQIKYNCLVCNKEFFRKPSWKNSKFCSIKCRNQHWNGANNPNWKNGISFEPYGLDWTIELREKIRKRDKFTCQLCHITEKEHYNKFGRILTIHHIDYNKQNCKEDNLITLCCKCNAKVNGNRDYWFSYFKYKLEEVGV